MRDDADVARVAAALNAPGLRYRSFNNAPVRIYAAVAREDVRPELPAPLPEPAPPPAMAVEPALHDAYLAEAPALLDQDFEYAAAEAPMLPASPASAAVFEPAPEPPRPEPEPAPSPLFTWPEVTPAPPIASELPVVPDLAPVPWAQPLPAAPNHVAPAAAAAPIPMRPEPAAAPDYRLFNLIGRPDEPTAAPAQPQAGHTTLAMLRSRIEAAPDRPLPFQGVAPPAPPAAAPPVMLQPASAVTVPLSDVMRMIAAGSPPPASPFEAFRSALSAQPPR